MSVLSRSDVAALASGSDVVISALCLLVVDDEADADLLSSATGLVVEEVLGDMLYCWVIISVWDV